MSDWRDHKRVLKIGTRGSPLALAQAYETRSRLIEAHDLAEGDFEIIVIKTSGDKIQDRPLGEVGGKGLFTKEIEEALLSSKIDIAVHSMKDMPTLLPDGLMLSAYLPREDVRDAFISHKYDSIASLPKGAVLGSSSLRRRAQLRLLRPDLELVEFRGNVQTRMRKLGDGVADATFLAMAGLQRLGMTDLTSNPISIDEMLPAVAQGAIGIEQRSNDEAVYDLLRAINHAETELRLSAERSFLAALDGSCQTPIGGLAELSGDRLLLRGEIIKPDGSCKFSGSREVGISDAVAAGQDLAAELKTKGGADFFI